MSHEIGKQSETVHLLQHFANARKVQGGAVLFRFPWVAGHASGLIIPDKVARRDDERRSGRAPPAMLCLECSLGTPTQP
jgi:hypothetical protein